MLQSMRASLLTSVRAVVLESVHVAVTKLVHVLVSASLHVVVLTSLSAVVLYVVLLTGMGVMPLSPALVWLSKLVRVALPSAGHWWYYHQRSLGR